MTEKEKCPELNCVNGQIPIPEGQSTGQYRPCPTCHGTGTSASLSVKEKPESSDIACPFCGDNEFGGFDKIGLKFHLSSGHCEVYNETEQV